MDELDRIARPRIDPSRTPFTATRAFRRYGLVEDPDPSSPEALYTKAVIQEQGFDGLPHVVSSRGLDRYVAGGEVELFRGVTDARFAEQLRIGDFFVGRGGELNGMYAAAGPHALAIARQYAGSGGTIIRMTLKRQARVIRWAEVEARTGTAVGPWPTYRRRLPSPCTMTLEGSLPTWAMMPSTSWSSRTTTTT
jgi:hypothetical protein